VIESIDIYNQAKTRGTCTRALLKQKKLTVDSYYRIIVVTETFESYCCNSDGFIHSSTIRILLLLLCLLSRSFPS
jgi:hypothetical protein